VNNVSKWTGRKRLWYSREKSRVLLEDTHKNHPPICLMSRQRFESITISPLSSLQLSPSHLLQNDDKQKGLHTELGTMATAEELSGPVTRSYQTLSQALHLAIYQSLSPISYNNVLYVSTEDGPLRSHSWLECTSSGRLPHGQRGRLCSPLHSGSSV
jgi:hypothetical protein